MYRTIEQWRDFDCADAAYNDAREFISDVMQGAISDLLELARQRDELLARIGAAEAKLDYAINDLELIASTDSIDAMLDPDRAIRVAKAAVKFIREQTK